MMFLSHLLPPLLFALLPSVSSTSTVPRVITGAGTIVGTQCLEASNAVAFKGIPYAKPPVGNLRFAPSAPFSGHYAGGYLNATTDPPSCIQFGKGLKENGPTSDDCLYLNVYSPANATRNSALPVRVWLYGGSNTDGGIVNPLYDGCNVAAHDAIMVSINYRLGPLGFLMLRDSDIMGNQALKDQVLALQWVQGNIAAFGGDPVRPTLLQTHENKLTETQKKVMLHGQSAGARDAFTLATLPEAPELFTSAIFESGAGRETTTCSNAQKIGESYAAALNCSTASPACLRDKSTTDLVAAYQGLSIINTGFGHFPGLSASSISTADLGPAVDGDFIKVQPSKAGVSVPSIFGYTSNDGALFVATSPAFSNPLAISASNYTAFLTQSFGAPAAALIESHLPFSTFNATSAPGFAALEYVFTAWEYQCPAYRAAKKAVANGVDAWTYAFDHTPSCPWIAGLSAQEVRLLGPTHTSEIPFVLGHTRRLPQPDGNCSLNAVERGLSEFMLGAWTRMAERRMPADGEVWPPFGGDGNGSLGVTFGDAPVPGPIDFDVCELFDAIRDAQLEAARDGSCKDDTTAARNRRSLTKQEMS